MWPAFWSYGNNWPTNGEIDILEAKGHEPFAYSTNYFYGRRASVPLSGSFAKVITSNVSLVDCYHVYEVIWQKASLTFLLDGQVVDTKTGGYVSDLFGKAERVTLNLAVGGDYVGNPPAGNIVPGTMLVDYVKVFTSR
jgi:beta-glucanase (GH16 family)